MSCKVTVAVSVYNLLEYVEPCVKNILEQDYQDVEIILADDCSTDGSWEKCLEVCGHCTCVKVIRNSMNMRQGATLENAISIATGQWLLLMDVDDRIEKNCISSMLKVALENHVDVVLANYKTVDTDGTLLSVFKPEIEQGLYTSHDIAGKLIDHIGMNVISCIGSKLYHMNFVKKKKIQTETDLANYDLSFALDAIRSMDRLYYINEAYYIYLQRKNSVGHSYKERMFSTHYAVRKKIKEFFLEQQMFEEKKRLYYYEQFLIIKKAIRQEVVTEKGNFKEYKETFHEICACDDIDGILDLGHTDKADMKDKLIFWSIRNKAARLLYFMYWIDERILN